MPEHLFVIGTHPTVIVASVFVVHMVFVLLVDLVFGLVGIFGLFLEHQLFHSGLLSFAIRGVLTFPVYVVSVVVSVMVRGLLIIGRISVVVHGSSSTWLYVTTNEGCVGSYRAQDLILATSQ